MVAFKPSVVKDAAEPSRRLSQELRLHLQLVSREFNHLNL
jgi:hypothetical protein